ncbi:MAG: hypothetical protein JST26_00355 [Bacteroidetes bacterium]|nr:hypothetical protein [Bacteroidota bacterium]
MRHVISVLEGTWCVISSSLPMWLNGDRTQPSFTYTHIKIHGQDVLLDETMYYKNGKCRVITGIDYPRRNKTFGFVWRHKFLPFIKSKWEVVFMNEHEQWAVIYFGATFFTPAGVDIISKGNMTVDQLKRIKAEMLEHPLVKDYALLVRDI